MGISFPFESKNIGTADNPIYDRAITSEIERAYNKAKYTNGVFANPADGFVVNPGGGMTIKVLPGKAHIEGAYFVEDTERLLALTAASGTYNRIDRVVLRFDTSEAARNIDIFLKKGNDALSPVPPDLIREPNVWELAVADIYISKGMTTVSAENIIDRRPDPEVCGMVLPAIPYEAQSANLWNQLSESVQLVESALDGTTAGNLQTQITDNNNNLQEQITSNDGDIATLESRATQLESDIEIDDATLAIFQSLGYTGGGYNSTL